MSPALPLFLALCPQITDDAAAPERLIALQGAIPPDSALEELGLDRHALPDGAPGWLASDEDLARLAARGVRHTIVHADQAEFYRRELRPLPVSAGTLGGWLSPPYAGGSMGGYYTFAELVSVLDQLAAAYPAICSPRFSLGKSVQGRDLWAVEISDQPGLDEGEPEVRIDGLHHAREPMSTHAPLWFALSLLDGYGADPLATYLVDERRIFFVPVVNPDGYVYNQQTDPGGGGLWRKNRRNNGDGSFGVDLNRNYAFKWGVDNEGSSPSTSSETYRGPAPASEPEVQAMQAFLASRLFSTALTVHTFSDLLLHPWGYTTAPPPQMATWNALSPLLVKESGLPWGQASTLLYLANGSTLDQDLGVHGTLSWAPELGDANEGFWPPTAQMVPMAEKHLSMFQEVARLAGAAVTVQSLALVDLGDGDGFAEPGETFRADVALKNAGIAATSTPVVVDLAAPGAIVSGAPAVLGPLAPGAQAFASPAFTVAGIALAGTPLTFTLTVTYEGFAQAHAETLLVGEPIAAVRDEIEIELGWTAGIPGDDADTGTWERGDPIGTSSSGQPASPADDHTQAPGAQCYVTGNGGGSAGNDDVDGGATTLISPPIDLSDAGPATISYWRWFADLSTADDALLVSVSSDGGQSWVPVETASGNHNSWEQVSFVVSDLVPQTDEVRLRFSAADDPNNSVVEAAVDDLTVLVYGAAPRLIVYGTPAVGAPILVTTTGPSGALFALYGSLGAAAIPLPGIGLLELDPASLFPVATGAVPAAGAAPLVLPLPANPAHSGTTFYLQAGVVAVSELGLTNGAAIAVQ